MADRNAFFLGYRIKVDEDNNITYAYGSDKETNAVQVYLAPWKYQPEPWRDVNEYENKPDIDPRTDLMPNADAIPAPTEVAPSASPSGRSPDTIHVPSIYRGGGRRLGAKAL